MLRREEKSQSGVCKRRRKQDFFNVKEQQGKKDPMESGRHGILRLGTGDWMYQMGSHHFTNEQNLVLFLQPKSWAHGRCTNFYLDIFIIFEAM